MANPNPVRARTPQRKSAVPPLTVVGSKHRRGAEPLPVDEVTQRFAQCRSLGHEWRHQPRETNWDGIPIFVSRCEDCGTERRVYIPTSGANVKRRYIYPDGYQRKGEERLSSMQWRRILIVSLG